MARHVEARLGKDHRPGQIRRRFAAPQFAVDEVADATGRQAGRDARGDQVGQLEEAAPAHACEQCHRAQHAEQPAVERHAALPHREDLQRMPRVVAGLVEQHVPQAPADHHPEHAVEQHVLDVAARPAALRELRLPHAQRGQPEEEPEGDQVGDAIPVDGDRPELQGNGIELGVDEHAPAAW
jgi:hypothetical protein